MLYQFHPKISESVFHRNIKEKCQNRQIDKVIYWSCFAAYNPQLYFLISVIFLCYYLSLSYNNNKSKYIIILSDFDL